MMNVQRVTPILNVSSLTESFAWFEKLGWRRHPDGHTIRLSAGIEEE
jgi:hypothetical protein